MRRETDGSPSWRSQIEATPAVDATCCGPRAGCTRSRRCATPSRRTAAVPRRRAREAPLGDDAQPISPAPGARSRLRQGSSRRPCSALHGHDRLPARGPAAGLDAVVVVQFSGLLAFPLLGVQLSQAARLMAARASCSPSRAADAGILTPAAVSASRSSRTASGRACATCTTRSRSCAGSSAAARPARRRSSSPRSSHARARPDRPRARRVDSHDDGAVGASRAVYIDLTQPGTAAVGRWGERAHPGKPLPGAPRPTLRAPSPPFSCSRPP